MVMDQDKRRRNNKRSRDMGQPAQSPQPQPDRTRPLGPVPSMAYGRWGEELERQRIEAANRYNSLSRVQLLQT